MFFNFHRSLLLVLTCLMPLVSGFAEEMVTPSKTEAQNSSSFVPLLTTQEIIDSYHVAIEKGATHILVVWDTWDFKDSYKFIEYCYSNENIDRLINHYNAPGFYRVSAVFATHLDIYEQLNGEQWYPEYP